jgi:hypothetical protein
MHKRKRKEIVLKFLSYFVANFNGYFGSNFGAFFDAFFSAFPFVFVHSSLRRLSIRFYINVMG